VSLPEKLKKPPEDSFLWRPYCESSIKKFYNKASI